MKPFSCLRLGLFVHYVYFDSARWFENQRIGVYPGGRKVASIDELADGFNVADLVSQAVAMNAEYVMFTAWHADMNLLYPSEVMQRYRPGHCSKRDVISELYDALDKHGIQLILYVHPSDGHDFCEEDQSKLGWNDEGLYERWNDFINKVFAELAARYCGKVTGYWFDGGLPDQIRHGIQRLRCTIKKHDPQAVLIQNEAFNDNRFERWADYGCRERINPPYECQPIQVAPVITSEWWANCSILEWTPELAFKYLVLQSSCEGLEGGGVAFSTGPYVGGGWEPGVEEFFGRLGKYVQEYRDAIIGTIPSQAFVTPDRTALFQIDEHSQSKVFRPLVTATDSSDGAKTYLHILCPPYEKTVRMPIPQNGRVYKSACLFAGGEPVGIRQDGDGVWLTFHEDQMWSSLDTVVVLS